MFCSNCGHQLGDGPYCPACGNKVNNTGIVKPLLTDVGKDDSLPKNSNFILTIAAILFIISVSFIILTGYVQDNQYYTDMKWQGFNISIPLGFKGKVNSENGTESFLIQNDDIIYELYFDEDNYNVYKKNDFGKVREFLKKYDYGIESLDEIDLDAHKMIFGVIDIHSEASKYTAVYLTTLKDTDYMVWGYIYKSSPIDIDDGYKMIDIVNNINRS